MRTIFLHGLGQAPASWDKTLSYLPAGFGAVCPDLAALLAGGPVNYQRLYAGLVRYCGQFPGPVRLCGLSLGGVLALNYAAERPERVSSLALIGAQYKMPVKLLKLQNCLFRLMPQKAFTGTGFGKEDFLALSRSMLSLDFSNALGRIRCPALAVYGERDRANRRAAEELAEALPQGKLAVVPGAGHEVNIDEPEKLAEMLREFFEPSVG